MSAHRDQLAAILREHLRAYREMPYSELLTRLQSPHRQDFQVTEGTASDGTNYTIETSILWDDVETRHIRVISNLQTGASGCRVAILPIYVSDVADGFIRAPDGSFIDE